MNQPPFKSMLLDNNRGTNMIDGRYFAELSDSDEGAAVHYDNEVIEASSDQEAIGKAGWFGFGQHTEGS